MENWVVSRGRIYSTDRRQERDIRLVRSLCPPKRAVSSLVRKYGDVEITYVDVIEELIQINNRQNSLIRPSRIATILIFCDRRHQPSFSQIPCESHGPEHPGAPHVACVLIPHLNPFRCDPNPLPSSVAKFTPGVPEPCFHHNASWVSVSAAFQADCEACQTGLVWQVSLALISRSLSYCMLTRYLVQKIQLGDLSCKTKQMTKIQKMKST